MNKRRSPCTWIVSRVRVWRQPLQVGAVLTAWFVGLPALVFGLGMLAGPIGADWSYRENAGYGLFLLAISAVAAAVIGAMTIAGWLSSAVLLACAPGLITASIVAARPPAPARLRSLGWTLVAISTLTAAIVIATAVGP